MDVAILTETLQNHNDPMPRWINEWAPAQTPDRRTRGRGGVALAIAPHISYKVVVIIAGETFQMVIVRIGTLHVCGLYISPSEKTDNVLEIMNLVTKHTRGETIIIGDLNARNIAWDKRTNGRGAAMKRWATEKGWKIRAPNTPTHFPPTTRRASPSIIDLTITRHIDITRPVVCQGNWEGTSDHEPIKVQLLNTNNGEIFRTRPRRISHSKRVDLTTLEKAKSWYEEKNTRRDETHKAVPERNGLGRKAGKNG